MSNEARVDVSARSFWNRGQKAYSKAWTSIGEDGKQDDFNV